MVADAPYGATVLLQFVSGNIIPASWVTSAQQLGLSWLRIQMPWNVIETSLNTWSWSALDTNVATIAAAGINVYFVMQNPLPSWRKNTNAGGGVFFPSPADGLAYAQALVGRYYRGSPNGYIAALEWGNEQYDAQNDSAHNGGYAADVLNTIYPAIKSVDPTVLVLPPAHLLVNKSRVTAFHTQLYSGGGVSGSGGVLATGRRAMDASNAHFYRGVLIDPTDPNVQPNNVDIYQMIAEIQAVDLAYGQTDIKLWLTEFGWPANMNGDSSHVSFATQNTYIEDVEEAGRNSGGYVSHAFVYTMNTSDSYSMIGPGTPPVQLASYTGLQAEIQAYPQWLGVPATDLVARGRDGLAVGRGRDGKQLARGRDGVAIVRGY